MGGVRACGHSSASLGKVVPAASGGTKRRAPDHPGLAAQFRAGRGAHRESSTHRTIQPWYPERQLRELLACAPRGLRSLADNMRVAMMYASRQVGWGSNLLCILVCSGCATMGPAARLKARSLGSVVPNVHQSPCHCNIIRRTWTNVKPPRTTARLSPRSRTARTSACRMMARRKPDGSTRISGAHPHRGRSPLAYSRIVARVQRPSGAWSPGLGCTSCRTPAGFLAQAVSRPARCSLRLHALAAVCAPASRRRARASRSCQSLASHKTTAAACRCRLYAFSLRAAALAGVFCPSYACRPGGRRTE